MTDFEKWYDDNRNKFIGPTEHNKYDVRAAWNAATERCLSKCEAERLTDNSCEPDDVAYNYAIYDCIAAIRGGDERIV